MEQINSETTSGYKYVKGLKITKLSTLIEALVSMTIAVKLVLGRLTEIRVWVLYPVGPQTAERLWA
jgi:hypothetical protein